ncbi:hypothetical protein BCR33DRAFT_717331 [Rhizoclosmatium globosum]|uniref:Uncharacterized protein n=1 Tax=Rhizoclosmatium globosum TaxID=329046 RepID=A0A1Y2C9C6_9FUNG|nr:hypothetical protein BCR33DRAFT_717331 [Rhizoclosmatium globosum]|eukprot:ORY43643.1 hypothetical protein BCR33DRAFT_717331 [Rhizoclosmatium globosum]
MIDPSILAYIDAKVRSTLQEYTTEQEEKLDASLQLIQIMRIQMMADNRDKQRAEGRRSGSANMRFNDASFSVGEVERKWIESVRREREMKYAEALEKERKWVVGLSHDQHPEHVASLEREQKWIEGMRHEVANQLEQTNVEIIAGASVDEGATIDVEEFESRDQPDLQDIRTQTETDNEITEENESVDEFHELPAQEEVCYASSNETVIKKVGREDYMTTRVTKFAFSTAKAVMPSPMYYVLDCATTAVFGSTPTIQQLEDSAKGIQTKQSTFSRMRDVASSFTSLSGFITTPFDPDCDFMQLNSSNTQRRKRDTYKQEYPHSTSQETHVFTRTRLQQLPTALLAKVLAYTVNPLESNSGIHLSPWTAQRIALIRLKSITRSFNKSVSEALRHIDTRDVYDPVLAKTQLCGRQYRRKMNIRGTVVSTSSNGSRHQGFGDNVLTFEVTPSETMYNAGVQYFRPIRLPSLERGPSVLCIKSVGGCKDEPEKATIVLDFEIDGTFRKGSLSVLLTDGFVKSGKVDVSVDQDGSVGLDVTYRVRKDMELSMYANPKFEESLKKGISMSEKLVLFEKWIENTRGDIVSVYKVAFVEVVAPTQCLFGGF